MPPFTPTPSLFSYLSARLNQRHMAFSFWEEEVFNQPNQAVIIGGGIVGLSTAIRLKELHPQLPVLVIEQYHPPQGASTKNAGFICFGSPTEVLSDLQKMTRAEVIALIQMRWQGAQLLQQRLAKHHVKAEFVGGLEYYPQGQAISIDDLNVVNGVFEEALGISSYFKWITQTTFAHMDSQAVSMPAEGQIQTGHMIQALHDEAVSLGVRCLFGYQVEHLAMAQRQVHLKGGQAIHYGKLYVCTNGFARQLLPDLDVKPARNHVLVTEPLPEITWTGVCHYDEGYYYFRRIGDRILCGGARNLDIQTEYTSNFEFSNQIIEHLENFLVVNLTYGRKVAITHRWTGIMGLADTKFPIVKKIDDQVFVGVRMGGMGVAIGSLIGKKLAEMQ